MPNSVQSESDQILLIGKDGASVPFSLSVLLAVSPLLRDTLRDTVCLCSTNISFPFVDFDILCLVAEILRQGESTCVMPLKEASTCVVKAQAVIDQLQIDACIGLNRSSGRVGSLLISNIESKTDIWSALTDSKMSESLNNNEIPGKMCYTCSFCWKDFESKMKMYKHVKLEHPETTHGCTSCGSRFIHQNNLDNHIRNAHPTNDQVTRQSDVDIKAENGPDQNESIDKSCKLLKKLFPCDFCEKVFTQSGNRRRHMVKRHCLDVNVKKGKKVHNLSKGEKVKRKISRKTKILLQGKIKDEESSKQLAISGSGQVEKFKCSECQKVFSTVKNLKIHKSKSAHCF